MGPVPYIFLSFRASASTSLANLFAAASAFRHKGPFVELSSASDSALADLYNACSFLAVGQNFWSICLVSAQLDEGSLGTHGVAGGSLVSAVVT